MTAIGHLRDIPLMGVASVLVDAAAAGFRADAPEWINLGQGQPESGALPGAPERVKQVDLDPGDCTYGPVNGIPELRAAVADHYNRTYRSGAARKYTAENIAIVQGGRLALNRVLAALGECTIGYRFPDYAGYSDMLGTHLARLSPVPIPTRADNGFVLDETALDDLVTRCGGSVLLMSNPCNPTGSVLAGEALRRLVDKAKATGCTLLIDEFYSHYHYAPGPDGAWGPAELPVSAAAHVADPETDQVLLIDGLTKNFRYPGWRLGWVVGPVGFIAALDRVGAVLDGGASRVAQRAALDVLAPDHAARETLAVRREFARKRDTAVTALREMGVRVDVEPAGTFYVWGRLDELPEAIADGDAFFRAALRHRVVTIPGRVFDVNPGGRRHGPSAYASWARFSFGPEHARLVEGLERLRRMISEHR
ncbi:pyridoxal phosphate-dependent aminotransferase [Actinokineospora fastidiosa]|uniref:Aminotransferase n=1 Tax=Actinokineospora fastidiosa TaxID=1816 RepID=A0A918GD05_9PSEU|nr:pyridoxal phosphate-dependent aminotransferase [Actinokineospora fastidiosa]GGS29554.1 aminotransferase [Actinokineospora fastidiosa]